MSAAGHTYEFGDLVAMAMSGRATTPLGRLRELVQRIHDDTQGPVASSRPVEQLRWVVEHASIPSLGDQARWRHDAPGGGRIATLAMAVAHVVAPDIEPGDVDVASYLTRVFFGHHGAGPAGAMNWTDHPDSLRAIMGETT